MRSVTCSDWFILLWCHWTNSGLLPKWQLWATFFISIIKIISIIGLICIMIQCKMLLLNQLLQKKWLISNLCSGQIKKIPSNLIFILCLADKSFSSVRPSVRRAVHSFLANRYIINCSSYSVHMYLANTSISRWNSNMGDLDLFFQIIQVKGHACLILSIYKAPF